MSRHGLRRNSRGSRSHWASRGEGRLTAQLRPQAGLRTRVKIWEFLRID
jgi:hypothetical protein